MTKQRENWASGFLIQPEGWSIFLDIFFSR